MDFDALSADSAGGGGLLRGASGALGGQGPREDNERQSLSAAGVSSLGRGVLVDDTGADDGSQDTVADEPRHSVGRAWPGPDEGVEAADGGGSASDSSGSSSDVEGSTLLGFVINGLKNNGVDAAVAERIQSGGNKPRTIVAKGRIWRQWRRWTRSRNMQPSAESPASMADINFLGFRKTRAENFISWG